jgi:hypothetical protein
MRTTLADVARAAGCAKATVSMALRGHPRIAAATRARISAAAGSLGYVPDPAISGLARLRWRSHAAADAPGLAWVTATPLSAAGPDRRTFTAAAAHAATLGHRLHPWSLRAAGGAAALGRQLQLRGQVGVLLAQIPDARLLDGFPWQDCCTVACGLGHAPLPVHVVKADPFRGLDLAWTHALKAQGPGSLGTVADTRA